MAASPPPTPVPSSTSTVIIPGTLFTPETFTRVVTLQGGGVSEVALAYSFPIASTIVRAPAASPAADPPSSSESATSPTPSTTPSTVPAAASGSPTSGGSSASPTPPDGVETSVSDGAGPGISGSANLPDSTGTPAPVFNNGEIGPGAVAGAAIGAAVGAALIAFLLTFFLCGRRRRGQGSDAYASEKYSPTHRWDAYLPQQADDNTISAAVKSLYSQIDMHVENFYSHRTSSTVSADGSAAMAEVDSGLLGRAPEQLLVGTTTLPAIKHYHAWTILSKLSPTRNGEGSLLPTELARQPSVPNSSMRRSSTEDSGMLQGYDYWRVLTAHLFYPQSAKSSNDRDSPRLNGKPVSDALTSAFSLWLKAGASSAAAEEHLQSVLRAASETGLLIMAQPSSFKFEWDILRQSNKESHIVVLPAFVKTADEHGEELAQRQVLVKPMTEALSDQ